MRRSDKEISAREDLDEILRKAAVCRLAFADENEPYLVPMNFGYDGKALYFHCAREGKKIDFIKKNDRVWFEAEGETGLLPKGEDACSWTMAYESVMGSGRAVIVTKAEEKLKALDIIMNHYGPGASFRYRTETVEKIAVIRVDVETMTGKRSPVRPAPG